MPPTHNLRSRRVPLTDLEPHPENPRRGDVPAIARSLQAHGQYVPITVQASTSYVIRGNHTYLAANHLGWTEIAAVFIDVTDQEARLIMLADNRTADLGEYDNQVLADLLAKVSDDDLGATGYTTADVESLLSEVAAVPTPEARGELLDRIDVLIDEPRFRPAHGEQWGVGGHTLFILNPVTDWLQYTAGMQPGDWLVLYPGPFLLFGEAAQTHRMVLVQPDPYIAGHLLTFYADAHGDDKVVGP